MKKDGLNTELDRPDIQEANSFFIVLDSNDLIVSCKNGSKYAQIISEAGNSFLLDCFWFSAEQRPFPISEFKKNIGKEIRLLFIPGDGESRRVKVIVESFQLFDRPFYSLHIQDIQTESDISLSTHKMSKALRADLDQDRLHLNYQPQINIVKDCLYGMEVLARWTSDEFGVIPPDQFIAIAEASGFIAELDLWVLRKACQQLASWWNQDIQVPLIAVNLSPLSLVFPQLKEEIQTILNESGIDPSCLVLELTESIKIKPVDPLFNVISELHSIGINISLDDFGTGYSNLKRLLKFPVSQLKLDRTFVRALPQKHSEDLSEIVLTIGKKLGAEVIAEGVETQKQLSCLQEMGYQIIQGYFFSPPLGEGEVADWFYQSYSKPRSV